MDVPIDLGALYLDIGSGVPRSRPLMQGDVLVDIELLGFDPRPPAVILITHPCSMRRGAKGLRPLLSAVRIGPYQELQAEDWIGHGNVMPLPGLGQMLGLKGGAAAELREISVVRSQDIDLDTGRIASLSEEGLLLLQQRVVNHLTRVEVQLAVLREQLLPTLTEVDLQEQWVAQAAAVPGGDPPDYAAAEAAFQGFLGQGEGSLREQLQVPVRRSAVRRTVLEELERQSGGAAAEP